MYSGINAEYMGFYGSFVRCDNNWWRWLTGQYERKTETHPVLIFPHKRRKKVSDFATSKLEKVEDDLRKVLDQMTDLQHHTENRLGRLLDVLGSVAADTAVLKGGPDLDLSTSLISVSDRASPKKTSRRRSRSAR
eukprot:NODE_1590_length_578_cov_141.619780_g1576_i0.p1 GENE.NODE_1590_length_578_cov_141.619780_g1576_i0~~NODE_1590_length_578_cov_141.619780_g1576_i0.p1  ORF type:complete len:135 (+),score=16.45 NODE_1590_length_578_cov_141.619780_g1576_i0:37-441(+)